MKEPSAPTGIPFHNEKNWLIRIAEDRSEVPRHLMPIPRHQVTSSLSGVVDGI